MKIARRELIRRLGFGGLLAVLGIGVAKKAVAEPETPSMKAPCFVPTDCDYLATVHLRLWVREYPSHDFIRHVGFYNSKQFMGYDSRELIFTGCRVRAADGGGWQVGAEFSYVSNPYIHSTYPRTDFNKLLKGARYEGAWYAADPRVANKQAYAFMRETFCNKEEG